MKKGWFIIDGVQHGDRTVEHQLKGLETVSESFRGKAVLDLGSAEGLIGKHAVQAWGAARVDGVTAIGYEIDEALKQCSGLPQRFVLWDLRNDLPGLNQFLEERYDVVLALSILHKLRKPLECLEWAIEKAGELVVIRLPAPVIQDQRSFMVPTPVREWMNARPDFELLAEPETCIEPVSRRPEWMGIWKRRA